jgi:hypothetical protein
MLVKDESPNGLMNGLMNPIATMPVAILDKELFKTRSFQIEITELCTVCGARFGIGHFGAFRDNLRSAEEIEELPRKLIEILANDHRHDREHKGIIELDLF